MNPNRLVALAAFVALGLAGCEEDVPTSLDPGFFPVAPETVELTLPWSFFAEELEVFSGFGSPTELGHGVLANDFEGLLDARTLARFEAYPDSAQVIVEGAAVTSAIDAVDGRLIARFDTLASTNEGPVEVAVNALRHPWDPRTATWTVALDTINVMEEWPMPGGGPAEEVVRGIWDPASGDSLVLELDSATIAQLGDTLDGTRGLRVDLEDAGERIQVSTLRLEIDAIPVLRPDTVVQRTVRSSEVSLIYDPVPEPPPGGIRIGGVPAWRTVIEIDVPAVLDEPLEVCARVECPLTLEADRINAASLVLRSSQTPAAFQPTDTVRLDVRPVLAPERLPKSPLGGSLVGQPGRPVPPEAFGPDGGSTVTIPLTSFVRDQIRGETASGVEAPRTLALLSFFEPLSISFASFQGPGGEGEPEIRLIVTLADTVEVR